MFPFIASSLLVAVSAVLQTTSLIFINGIKPDLTLSALAVIYVLERGWPKRVFCILIAGTILKITPQPNIQMWLFIVSAFVVAVFVDYLPWKKQINFVFAIVAGTMAVNASSFIISRVAIELACNLAVGLIIYVVAVRFDEKTRP